MTQAPIAPVYEPYSSKTTSYLLGNINHPSPLERYRVMSVLGKRLTEDNVFDKLIQAIADPINVQAHILAFISVSWMAIASVLENGNTEQLKQLKTVMQSWDQEDKENLLSWLRHEPKHVSIIAA